MTETTELDRRPQAAAAPPLLAVNNVEVVYDNVILVLRGLSLAVPKGAIVALHMAAANRDPRRFEDPDRFLITRPAAKNLSFGHGIHFCLGAHLAAQEVRAAIGGLLPHLEHVELTDTPLQRNPTALLNGWKRIELVWAS